jgi:uncharacterized protein (DUF1800 family)
MLEQAPDRWTRAEAAHLLNRAAFGGSPGTVTILHAMGRHGAVDSLLKGGPREPDPFPAPAWAAPEAVAAETREWRKQMREARVESLLATKEEAEELRRKTREAMGRQLRERGRESALWWCKRMISSTHPLQEKMTLFWHDHFPTSIRKVRQPWLLVWQNERLRRHALGNFKTLTSEIIADPAMALYLDASGSRAGSPNENLARELLELFTLGEGNYTEQDVREAARALTGYQHLPAETKMRLIRKRHDAGPKTILGETAAHDAQSLVDLIFRRPEPSRMLAGKLWRFFVDDHPPRAEVAALAAALRASGHETAPALRTLFLSKRFYEAGAMRSQIKSPVQFTIQLVKELEIDTPFPGMLLEAQRELGQMIFQPPNVAGWDWGQAWISTNTLLARYNFAGKLINGPAGRAGRRRRMMARDKALARRGIMGPDLAAIAPAKLRANPEALVDALIERFFHGPVAEDTRKSFLDFARQDAPGEPDDDRIAGLLHLILSTPAYQLC